MALQEEFEKQGVWLFRYRSLLPLIILFVGAAVFVYTKMNPGAFFLDNTPYGVFYEYACILVSLLGLYIRVYTVGHTPRNTSGRNVTEQVADSLNTTGIYSIVRHPLYLGNFFMWLGPAMLSGNLWFIVSFCFFYWIYYERIMFAEEQFLRRQFGDKYISWSDNVPAFIPNFKNFVKPSLTFSWKKTLKKEKNGLAAVFIIFSVFDVAGKLIQKDINYNYPLHILSALSVVAYLTLRYLKNKTKVLEEDGR